MNAKTKWLVGALTLSLALNIFVAGTMLGKGFRGDGHDRHRGPPSADFNLKRFGKHLNDEQRDKVREILRDARKTLGVRFRDVRASEERIKALVSAPELDIAALQAAMESHAALMQQVHRPIKDVMLDVIAELDAETRQKIAEDMFKRRERRGKPRRDHSGQEDGAEEGQREG